MEKIQIPINKLIVDSLATGLGQGASSGGKWEAVVNMVKQIMAEGNVWANRFGETCSRVIFCCGIVPGNKYL